MGSRSKSKKTTTNQSFSSVDNSITLDNSYRSTTDMYAEDNRQIEGSYNTLDGGAIDGIVEGSANALALGEAALDGAYDFGEAAMSHNTNLLAAAGEKFADSLSDFTAQALGSVERNLDRSLDSSDYSVSRSLDLVRDNNQDLVDTLESTFGESLAVSDAAFKSALVFADKKTTSENQQLLEGFQKNTLLLAGATTVTMLGLAWFAAR